jgi:hypothetical protein
VPWNPSWERYPVPHRHVLQSLAAAVLLAVLLLAPAPAVLLEATILT